MTAADAPTPSDPNQTRAPTWRDAWQVPVLAISGLALAGGIAAVLLARPSQDVTPRIEEAAKLVEAEKFEQALTVLNEDVWPQIEKGRLPAAEEKKYYALAATSIFEAAAQRKLVNAENYENVIKSYVRAEELKQRLDPADIDRFVQSLMALDRLDEARRRIESLPSGEQVRKIKLVRQLITRILAKPVPDQQAATDLVAWLLAEPSLPESDRVWAMTRQAELRLIGGFRDEAIRGMLQQLPRLDEGAQEERGELLALLGRGYLEGQEYAESEKWLKRAEDLANEREPLTSKVRLCLAKVAESRSDFQAAKDLYQRVLDAPGSKRFRREALLGIAEAAASLDETEASLDAYSRLVDSFHDNTTTALTKDTVADSAMARFRTRFEAGDARTALRYASIGESLFERGRAPGDVLLGLGESHRKLALDAIAEATGGLTKTSIADLDPTTRKEAREHFVAAANALRAHAGTVAGQNGPAYGDSIWAAADCFDRAGDQDKAISLFKQFADEFPNDPRMAEAKFRLGRCYQARGDLELAARTYEDLIATRDGAPGQPGSGPFADASYVPLAQTYLATGTKENIENAEQKLLAVVNGEVMGVESPGFRDALAELGTMFYRAGDKPERAIEYIDELLRRYPDQPGLDLARFRLADSYRLSAAKIERSMAEGMPDEERQNLEKARVERLQKAAAGFEQVRRALDAKPADKRSVVEETYLRNSCFYVGDCIFALKDYDGAIRAYTAARDRYPTDPASLVAMIQIVNANLARGDVKAALTANERAKRFYRGLPAEVWNDPNLPMGKDDWERWLDSTDRLANGEALDHERPD